MRLDHQDKPLDSSRGICHLEEVTSIFYILHFNVKRQNRKCPSRTRAGYLDRFDRFLFLTLHVNLNNAKGAQAYE